jgi:hypothetical protein
MVIILALLIPITAVITAYSVLKAYTLGLKHNYEVKHEIMPQEVKMPNPFQELTDKKQAKEEASILEEYFYEKE